MVARIGSLVLLLALPALAQTEAQVRPILNGLTLERYSVTVEASEALAKVVVEETFFNPGGGMSEADFYFPLPVAAAASGLELQMGGRFYGGNLITSERARDIYRRITRRSRDPALLDCVGRNLFRCRVFPVPGRGRAAVRFAYTQPLAAEGSMRRLVIPLDAARFNRSPAEHFALTIRIRGESALQAVLSPTHDVEIERPSAKEATIRLEAKRAYLAGDLVVLFSTDDAPLGAVVTSYRDRGGKGYFVLSVDAAFAREQQEKAPRDVVLAVDTSNSTGRNGVDAAAAAVADAVSRLRAGKDRYALMAFGTEPRLVSAFRHPGDESQAEIRALYAKEPVAGRTSLGEAILGATTLASDTGRPGTGIILLTDGIETESGADALDLVRRTVAQGSRVGFCGLGTGADTVHLDALGARGEGDSAYAVRGRGLTGSVGRLLDSTRAVPLTDVRAVVDNAHQIYPRRLRMLRAGDPLVVVGRYDLAGSRKITISAKVGGEQVERTLEVKLRKRGGDPAVARMWAARRVGDLLDQARTKGKPELHKAEIRMLGRRHGIVTPHTSLLVLEEADQKRFLTGMKRLPLMNTTGGGTIRAQGTVTAEVAVRAELGERIKRLKQCRSGAADPFSDLLGANRLRMRSAAGRTFYRSEDGTWVESALADAPLASARSVRFLSDEWQALADADTETARILALGRQVLFTNADGNAVRVVE
ncbi:MAG: VIT domain-containing protein, partial [Planctomycetota bacterium]|jgi:Ca-activated chloride channel family protein